MAPQRVGARKAPPTAPRARVGQAALAHELLLARVQALVPLAVVLARESLAAHRTHERPLVSVGAQVRAEVVGAREAFGAEGALERRRMFLHPLAVVARRSSRGIREIEDIVAVRNGRGG